MKQKRTIHVTPCVSFEDIARYCSPVALQYKTTIETLLKSYSTLDPVARTISVGRLHGRINSHSAALSIPFQKAEYIYFGTELVSLPFLLGLAHHHDFLDRIWDIQSIEILDKNAWFQNKLRQSSQLCLRRGKALWSIDISSFIQKGSLNASQRESPTSVNILSFVEEPPIVGVTTEEDLSKKTIG